jgi:YidC/Oxa1 family membrane protein insertase
MGEIFTLLFVQPITNVLIAIYQLLIALHIPSPLGFSIILLTIVIRLVLYPLMGAQLKSSKKMQDVAPLLAALKEKYKGNASKIQSETMLLYKQNGINPAAGCFPVIVQLPVIWGLYTVLQEVVKLTSLAQVNKLVYVDSLRLSQMWDPHFFSIPLGQTPAHLVSTVGFGILILPILTGASQFIQSKMMIPAKKPVATTVKKDSTADFATAFQTQSLYIFPLMIGFFSYNFPVGLSFYWITFTVFGIIQQYLMQKNAAIPVIPLKLSEKKTVRAKGKKKK